MHKSNRQHKQKRSRRIKPRPAAADTFGALPKSCERDAAGYQSAPHQSSKIGEKECRVSLKFLEEIIMLLGLREDADHAASLRQVSKRRLVTLKRKMRYLQRCNAEMSEQALDARSKLEEGMSHTTEALTFDDDVLLCEDRMVILEAAVSDIDRQSSDLDASWRELMADGQKMLDRVVEELLRLLQVKTPPSLMDETKFLVKQLSDDALLQSCEDEEDCDLFVNDVLGQKERLAMKYPRQPLEDFYDFRTDLLRRRDDFAKAAEELAELERAHEDGTLSNNEELKEVKSMVQATEQTLKDAVENSRFAGVMCTSDGSQLSNQFTYNSLEIRYDPFGRKRFPEEGNDEDENEEGDNVGKNEMMVAAAEEKFHQNQEKTEKWLFTAHADRDPAEISPITPVTPNTGAFLTKLQDIAIEDSVSVVAGVMLVPPVNHDPIERLNIDEWQIECLLMRKELASEGKSIADVSQEESGR